MAPVIDPSSDTGATGEGVGVGLVGEKPTGAGELPETIFGNDGGRRFTVGPASIGTNCLIGWLLWYLLECAVAPLPQASIQANQPLACQCELVSEFLLLSLQAAQASVIRLREAVPPASEHVTRPAAGSAGLDASQQR